MLKSKQLYQCLSDMHRYVIVAVLYLTDIVIIIDTVNC